MDQRNRAIRQLREAGFTYEIIGKTFSISKQRVCQILNKNKPRKKAPKFKNYVMWNGEKKYIRL